MPYALDPLDRKALRNALLHAFDSVARLMVTAADAGIEAQRIDQTGSIEIVADRVLRDAERLGRIEALLKEVAQYAPAVALPRILPWASLSDARVKGAREIHIYLNVNSRMQEPEIRRALPGLAPPDLVIPANLVAQPDVSAPAAHQWPIVWDRLEDLGAVLRTHDPEATLHIFGHAPLPVWMNLGFQLRDPGGHRVIAYQQDPSRSGWEPWFMGLAPPARETGAGEVFQGTESALDPGRAIGCHDAPVLVLRALPYPIQGDVLADQRAHNLPSDSPCLMLTRKPLDGQRRTESELLTITPAEGAMAAREVREALRRLRHEHGGGPIHIFYAGPQALAFLIGTQLNALGTMFIYNHSKDSSSYRNYDLAGRLRS